MKPRFFFISCSLIAFLSASASSRQSDEVTSPRGGLMTLEQCLERARQNNYELRDAALEIEAASEQKREAFTNYFPRISANVLAFKLFDEMVKIEGTYPQEIAALSQQFIPLIGMPFSV